jgi:hypothetical protein
LMSRAAMPLAIVPSVVPRSFHVARLSVISGMGARRFPSR